MQFTAESVHERTNKAEIRQLTLGWIQGHFLLLSLQWAWLCSVVLKCISRNRHFNASKVYFQVQIVQRQYRSPIGLSNAKGTLPPHEEWKSCPISLTGTSLVATGRGSSSSAPRRMQITIPLITSFSRSVDMQNKQKRTNEICIAMQSRNAEKTGKNKCFELEILGFELAITPTWHHQGQKCKLMRGEKGGELWTTIQKSGPGTNQKGGKKVVLICLQGALQSTAESPLQRMALWQVFQATAFYHHLTARPIASNVSVVMCDQLTLV